MNEILESLYYIKKLGLYPDVKIVQSAPDTEVYINGKKYLLFCSNNYLGLSTNKELIEKTVEAFRKYGTGSGGSRLLSGSYDSHINLESTISRFKHTEDTITFSGGFQGNAGVIEALAKPFKITKKSFIKSLFSSKTVIISDYLNHASIIDGCKNSKAEIQVYPHSDMTVLEKILVRNKNRRKFIITDGVFSMDGDIAKLNQIVNLAQEYNAFVYVDDAHSTGVLGEFGGGTAEHFGLQGKIDLQMGTFSKAVGFIGGYITGKRDLIEYLRIGTRSYIFSAAMPPAIAKGIEYSFRIIHDSKNLRKSLFDNSNYLRDGLHRIGFNTLNSETQIIPIFVGEESKAIHFSNLLFQKNILGFNVRWPAVEKGKSRIRLSVMATHTKKQIDYLLNVCEDIKKKINI